MIIIKRFTRIISLIMSFAMVFSLCSVNVRAASFSAATVDTIWAWLFQGSDEASVSMLDYVETYFRKDAGCSVAPNKLHHWLGDTTFGLITDRIWPVCTYCGMEYTDYLAVDYSDYVESLPATGYASDGSFHGQHIEICTGKHGVTPILVFL